MKTTAGRIIIVAGLAGFSLFGDVEPDPPKNLLTMEAFRREMTSSSYELAAQQLDLEISRVQARGEYGVLEPALVAEIGRSMTERQNSVEQSLSQNAGQFLEDADTISGGLEGVLPLGTQYWAGTSWHKRTNNLTSPVVPDPFTSEYLTFTGVRITQPLLKGAGMSSVMGRARIAEVEIYIRHEELRKKTMELISQGELAYWNLTLFQYLLGLREESVAIAQTMVEDNRERVGAGKMSEREILEAESGLALRYSQLIESRHSLLAAANMVNAFLARSPDWSGKVRLEASDQPVLGELKVELGGSIGNSLQSHPDYLSRKKIIEQEDVRMVFMEKQRWPQLDLVASYGLNGIGDSTSSTYAMARRSDYEAWSLGVELRIPLGGGIREKADLRAAERRKFQALLELKSAEVEIANALDTAIHRVNATRQQAHQYERMVTFSERLLESEIGLLDAGKSDSRRVLQIEQELVDGRIAYFQSLVAHRRAWLDWEVAEGSLLAHREMEPTFARR